MRTCFSTMQEFQDFDLKKFNQSAREEIPIVQIKDLKADYSYKIEKARLVRTQCGLRIVLKIYDVDRKSGAYSFYDVYLPEKFLSSININTLDSFNSKKYIMRCEHREDKPSLIHLEKAK